MPTQSRLDAFTHYVTDLYTLHAIQSLVRWDHEINLPAGAAADRATHHQFLGALFHDRLTDPRMGDWLAFFSEPAQLANLTNHQQVMVREIKRDFDRAIRVPKKWVDKMSMTRSKAHHAWISARQENSFALFSESLKALIALAIEYASFFESAHPYDAHLDKFEPGATLAALTPVLSSLQHDLTPLVAIAIEKQVAHAIPTLTGPFPITQQEALGRELLTQMGFDFNRGALHTSTHPFCSGFSRNDVRLTTRYKENDLREVISSVLHEGGHGLYEQGFEQTALNTPMAESISLGIHESQSRLWENMVGRSRAFARYLEPILTRLFPSIHVSADSLYHHLTEINPANAIRVDADELTYNLHVLIRFDLEIALMNGDLAVDDLPDAWNSKSRDYLGITPPNAATGVLQDIHWAHGMFGYFPTYILGNLYAAQLWTTIQAAFPTLDEMIATGDWLPIKEWLNTHIHRFGKKFSASEICKKATGAPLSSQHLVRYLQTKFGENV